jgi:S-formylglutathione hydrolase FrmB
MSLTDGWLPVALQLIAAAVLMYAVGWRSRRWRTVAIPIAATVGLVLAAAVYWYLGDQGFFPDPAPAILWVWVALTGVAAVLAVLGWRGTGWLRRGFAVLAVLLCVLCSGVAVNIWVGYFPTVQSAWGRLGADPPRWVDAQALAEMQRREERPTEGVIVKVTTPAEPSGFPHRQEFVYLPPAWFATNPPPKLPAVMMLGGAFGRPDDWLQSTNALKTLDDFTARHHGNAPVLVFPDVGGQFSNDTECVNGPRGNAADHLTKSVIPYVTKNFGTSSAAANWGLVGWSAGGTCALMLAVRHPELFSAFVEIDGQLGPNAGEPEQTFARLFGGDVDAWASFDPKTIVVRHGHYDDMSAWFAVSSDTPTVYRAGSAETPSDRTAPDWRDVDVEDHPETAKTLCSFLSGYGIDCSVVSSHASHDFAGAGKAFAAALPWLAGRLDTPGVRPLPLPGENPT